MNDTLCFGVLMFMYYYTVCYFTCTFYAVVRHISMLFIDNEDSVFCIPYSVFCLLFLVVVAVLSLLFFFFSFLFFWGGGGQENGRKRGERHFACQT